MSENRESEHTLGSMLAATSVLYGKENVNSEADVSASSTPNLLTSPPQQHDGKTSPTSGTPLLIQSKMVVDDQWNKA